VRYLRAVACVLAGGLIGFLPANAADGTTPPLTATASCPDRLYTEQTPRDPPPGFTVVPAEGLESRLSLVSFTEGDGEFGADVQPEQRQVGGKLVRTWRFSERTVRLHCAYAATRLVLIRPLPAPVAQCIATLDPRVRIAGEPKLLQLACR
jgi:hypothetical protein